MRVSQNERRAKLSPAKQSLLQQRLQGEQPKQLSITRRTVRHEFPLSFAQQRLWFIHQLDPSSPAYNIPYIVRLRGNFDHQAVQHALDEVVRRHEVLRTKFLLRDGIPLQQPAPDFTIKVEVSTLKGRDWEEQEAEARILAQILAARPFDLERGPLLRLNILVLHRNEYVLVLTMHHIVSDGWSAGIMMQEFSHFYTAFVNGKPSPLPDLPIQYADFALWQREWLRGGILETQLAYWRKQLAALPVLDLPTDHPRPAVNSYRGAGIPFHIPISIVSRLMALNQSEKTTLFMALITAFAVLLSRFSGQKDLAIGSPIAHRNRKEAEGLIGFFVNTLVMRQDLHGNPTFKEMLNRVRQTAFEAYQNQDVPFEKIVEELQPEREANSIPLFQVTLSLQNTGQLSIQIPCLTVEPFDVPVQTNMFDISLMLHEEPAGLNATLIYSSDLFDADTMARFSRHFEVVLERMSLAPETTIDGWPLLTQQEMQQELVEWNPAYAGQTEVQNLAYWFHQQALRNPEDVAVVCDQQQLTYSGLSARANQMAHRLIRLGVALESKVAVCMERSLEMIVAIVGILRAGGAYVPIDPACPQERMSYILEDSGALLLITHAPVQSKLPQHTITQLRLDEIDETIAPEDTITPSVDIDLDNAAYVIYTSGSTGRPKGVIVSHRNVARLLTSTQHWFGFSRHDTWTLFHSYAFDFSVWEIWGALLYGGCLVIVPYWVSRTPELCYELIKTQKVTVLNQTPSAFGQLIDISEVKQSQGDDLSLRLIIFGGEALDISALQPWFTRQGDSRPRLINMYGITETTVHVTYQPLTKQMAKANSSLIGANIPDLRVYVLDPDMQPVPVGVRGELYVGGAGLARGYVNRPDLTAERFVPDPFAEALGERLYRSGDQARRRTDGTLEYLGRLDCQVKIRGFRIELGEIESVITECPGVKQAVVLASEEKTADKRLVAYVVAQGEVQEGALKEDLRNKLKAQLPAYMMPAEIYFCKQIPLTTNGKVDRKALLALQSQGLEIELTYVAPKTSAEKVLCNIFAEVLGLKKEAGIHSGFFEIGGHSLHAVRLLALIEKRLGRTISLIDIFQNPTVEALAAVLDSSAKSHRQSCLVPIHKGGSRKPFYLVHPVGGTIFCYQALAHWLGARHPVYAFQSRGLNGNLISHSSIPEMAEAYVDELIAFDQAQSYCLGGWSMGGAIAFEMARQLVDRGMQVDLLALIDSYPSMPSEVSEIQGTDHLLWSFAQDLGISPGDLTGLCSKASRSSSDELFNGIIELAKQAHILPADLELGQPQLLFKIFSQNWESFQNYVPRVYTGKLILFQAAESSVPGLDLLRLWRPLAAEVQSYTIPGQHYTLIQQPISVSKIANYLGFHLTQKRRFKQLSLG
jgi:amino acid adenylation domain-containing protein